MNTNLSKEQIIEGMTKILQRRAKEKMPPVSEETRLAMEHNMKCGFEHYSDAESSDDEDEESEDETPLGFRIAPELLREIEAEYSSNVPKADSACDSS